MYILASHIFPMEGPSFSPGVLRIQDGRITAIGGKELLEHRSPSESFTDLSDHVLIPGFVNAHCHLELTALGPIDFSSKKQGTANDFVTWIRELVTRKEQTDENTLQLGMEDGIDQLLRSGVTCLGDHLSFNMPWWPLLQTPLRGRIFGEVLGIVPEMCEDIYSALKGIRDEFERTPSRFTFHISPHSVHAVHPEVLREVMVTEAAPLSCHLAESECEEEYFKTQGGAMTRLILNRGINPPHKGKSGLLYLTQEGLPVDKLMIVHGNYLDEEELEIIRKHKLPIVHCPGSHAYFGHKHFPLEEYLKKGLTIALGTDSITSNDDLDFLKELKLVRKNYPNLEAEEILKAATLGGAKALRMDQDIGTLTPGKKADLIGFRVGAETNPLEAILSASRVEALMIEGQWILTPHYIP